MKATLLALTAAAATAVLAQPHAHNALKHRHVHPIKRQATATASVPAATAYAYVLDGQPLTLDQVCQGLDAGTLKFADGTGPVGVCNQNTVSGTAAAATASVTSAVSLSSAAGQFYGKNGTASATATASSSAASSAASGWSSSPLSGGTGVGSTFPDGTIPCSTFPSAYGAVALDYLGLGGWSGLQAVTIVGNAVTNIVTGVSGQTCTEGMMCSYACPPGYQKSQWPSTQGSTGQSVGGIQCKNGLLYLTNPSLSNSLCMQGVGGVQATNNAGSVVSICRTDYPGTESETIPVEIAAGQTQPITCPDAGNYYSWQGASTSAQYYLNPIGTSAAAGCKWGTPGTPVGNYAPINLGVGYKDGKTWLSIFQNSPTTTAQYSGTVELQGNLSGTCKYTNGQYCGVTGCNAQGCTVAVISGTATYVISS